MSKQDTSRLIAARAAQQKSVTVLLAARRGHERTLASAVAKLGGTIRYRDDDLGYLRVDVPTGNVEKASALGDVQTFEIDSTIPLEDPTPAGSLPVAPQPAPGADTPANNPYLPIGDTGAAQFVAAHPTFDGRGVTIGELDTGVALDHPALQKTTTGQTKIVDWVTATDPINDNDPTWVKMSTAVSGGTFTAANATWTAPVGTGFRFGVFNERDYRLGGEVGRDVNRDGNPAGSSGVFGVLWNGAGTVWVDANQNHSFTDERAMRDYRYRHDVGYFGTDRPSTPVIDRMPFVVQVDAADGYVNIGIVSGAHATHVAGILTGNGLFGGAMTGAAPGAKLVSVRVCMFITGCTSHAMTEGMIYAVKDAHVDVISMSIGGLPALNDGNNTRAELYNRLINQYNVQMFISAGNSGPGGNTVGDPSVVSDVVSVGAYVTDATWRADYGSDSPYRDNLHQFSSRGPAENGGFKPDIVAPGAAVSGEPMWQDGAPVPGTYPLPPGYAMMNGTSMAAPEAGGATALLISAAKQQHFGYKADQLRQAIKSSARFIDHYTADEQGAGLFNVDGAYRLLRRQVCTVDITATVPVNSLLSGYLATPGIGVGIYDREGVTRGVPYTRTYTLTRTSGPMRPVSYRVSWLGNDGTFSAPATVTLPRNTPVAFDVRIDPAGYGDHSAILRLDDPGTAGYDLMTMNMVAVPYEFSATAGYQHAITGEVGKNQALHYFFRIPEGTTTFKVDFSGPSADPGTGQGRFLRWNPYGMPVDSNASANCYSPPAPSGCAEGSPNSRTLTNPMPGVWEVTVDTRRTSDTDFAPFTLTASALGVHVSPLEDVIDPAAVGGRYDRVFTVTNSFLGFTGRAVGGTLSSARQGVFTIANQQTQSYDLTVAPGSTRLSASIGNASDRGADLDLYVYDCTSGTCESAGESAGGGSDEAVTIAAPAPGVWRIVVDGYAVPSGSTTYDYLDMFPNAAFGAVNIADTNAPRGSGTTWTVPATVAVDAAPDAGRVLLGNAEIRTDLDALLASARVVVRNIS